MRRIQQIFLLFFMLIFLTVCAAAAPAGGGFVRSSDLGHGTVNMLSMSSDGSFVTAATQDGTIVLLNRDGGAIWLYRNSKSNAPNAVASIHPLGTRVLGGSGTYVYMINSSGFTVLPEQQNLKTNVYYVAFSTDGYGYSTAGNNLYFFDADGFPLFTIKTASTVWRFAISSDGNYIVAGTSDPDHRVYFYDRNQSLRWTYDTQSAVTDVAISYEGARVAVGAGQNLYYFAQNGALLRSYDYGSRLNGVSMSRDGKRIAVGALDGRVAILSSSGEILWENMTGGRVYDVVLSSDGTQLAVAVDSSVRLYMLDIPIMNPTPVGGVALGKPGTGSLTVISNPAGADVYIDNAYKGITPVTVIDLAPGQHTLLLKRPGYADWSTGVQVLTDTTISLDSTLIPGPFKIPLSLTVIIGALSVAVVIAGGALRIRKR